MKRRISRSKIAPVRIQVPLDSATSKITLVAYGNLVSVNKTPHIWCLFCDETKQLIEELQPLSLMPYFRLGCTFNNGYPINATSYQTSYSLNVSKAKNQLQTIPDKLLQPDLSQLHGHYRNQLCIPARNKYISLPDLILKTLCPDPAFTEIILEPISQSFILRQVLKKEDQLFAELDNLYSLRVNAATARQLAWLAGSSEYRAWARSIAIYAGEALISPEGKPWQCPLPDFKLKVDYSVIKSPGAALVYGINRISPVLGMKYKKITLYRSNRQETFTL
ncbi:hypothetical protein NX722_15665 [Endozoicomonas gorgoniicola]|uniref:Uncharacterized protein n=1 Tax=Endozoicomonas gorgoniicola TaxID=1234144 RepID=A0ABT3MXB8_9GAMM|nr:hypothetical protein [Endozoicomonas gorgoniicola]MCW7554030.1 hypothetical protein [Endozoicomonas gorgoniicola]